MTFWLNGEWRDDPVAIRIDDRGLLLGDGVFETMLVRNGVPAFLDRHLERLAGGLTRFSLDAPIPDNLRDIIRELAAKNAAADVDATLRLTVTRGPGERGLAYPPGAASRPTMLMTLARPGAKDQAERTLIVSKCAQAVPGAAAAFKTPAYLENIVAHNEALSAGCDDAVMLNPAGHVACATTSNIFVIGDDGSVATPPVADGALPGIVRGVLLDNAGAAGIAIEVRSITPDDLRRGAVFQTNSVIGLAPARLDGARNAASNEMFSRLDACYQDALAEDLRRAGAA